MHPLSFHLLLLALILLPRAALASVLAIDYGTDWIKASLMKPGVPFDVLLNKDSKRKMQSSVGWKRNDRLFGTDAFNLASRFPSDSFSYVKYLQAAPYESEAVSFFASISTVEIIQTSRHTAAVRRSDGTEWSPEELVAMQFSYVKDLAESVAGERVYDVIVTVPPFYSQFERDAVADAIEIAGLRTLALINDGTAVAINFAMTRSFPKPEYHVIYDAGASSIRATVVSFAVSPEGNGKGAGTTISVSGVGYDRSTGGIELDRRLREILIEKFNSKHKRDIRQDKKGMARLWKEAGRLKAILSANSDGTSTVESLAWDTDFKSKVTRASFEEACDDLKERFAQPILDALDNAGLTLDNITSVILTGGGTRTPMIQAAVKAAVGEDKISLNVNADEAAVLGAAFHGAGLSRQFKTKEVKVMDIGIHDIQARYFAASTSNSDEPRTITSLIFPAGSKTGTQKTLTFKRKEDFSLWLDYKTDPSPGFPRRLIEVEISGVSEALGNLTDRGALDPVVKATVTLSESGFVSVSKAIAFGEVKDDSIAGKLKGFFGAGSTSDEEMTIEPTPPRDTEPSSSASSFVSPSGGPSAAEDAKPKLSLKDLSTIPLNITTKFPSIEPLTVAEKRTARDRLRAIDREEAAKVRKEDARNTLEGYLYRVRDLLDEANPEHPFMKCSQEPERKEIAEKLEQTIAWLHEKGDIAETSQFYDKRNVIESLERPIVHRYQEIEAFPQALNISQMWNWSTRLFLNDARENLTMEEKADLPSKWSKEELDGLEKTLKEHEVWLNHWVEKQKSVPMNEDPVISTTEMKARAKTLEMHLQRLAKRKTPKAKKTTSTPTATPTVSDEVPTSSSEKQSNEGSSSPPEGDSSQRRDEL